MKRLIRPALLEDSNTELAPGFVVPPSGTLGDYKQYIEDALPAEGPAMFGLHPNAEINFLTATGTSIFKVSQRS